MALTKPPSSSKEDEGGNSKDMETDGDNVEEKNVSKVEEEEAGKRTSKRKRGEINTSVTLDVTESKRKDALFLRQINDLQAEEKSVRNGKHPDFKEQTKTLAKMRDRKLQDADLVRQLRIKEAEALYKFDVKSAKDAFVVAKTAASDRMLAEIAESIKKLEDLRDGVLQEEDNLRSNTRKTRSKRGGKNEESTFTALTTANYTTKKTNKQQGIGLDFFMNNDEINDDLQFIHNNWKKTAEDFGATNVVKSATVSFSNGVLTYNGKKFKKGAGVIVTTQITKEELLGEILELTKTEILVKLLDGSKARVLFTHLQSGRCTLASSDV